MLRASTQTYYIRDIQVGQIVFIHETAGSEFRMVLDVVEGLREQIENLLQSILSGDPYTLEVSESICINYSGCGSILFASGGENHDMQWQTQSNQMITCLETILKDDVLEYVKPLNESNWIMNIKNMVKTMTM